ncbi:hypothetical protein C1X44_34065, partial [Pseudomonas sp. MPR-AND1A]
MKGGASKRAILVLLAGTGMQFFPTMAMAQTAPQPIAGQEDPATKTVGDGNEIIVTARRRSETLQTTPVAITAVS